MPDYGLNSSIAPISVEELANRLADSSAPLQLIDVREPAELAIAKIEGFINLPLSQYKHWAEQVPMQFDLHTETIVLCHHGVRSAHMCDWLQQQGFTHVKNVMGGIEAYAIKVDPTIPRY
ncbi:rhodanese-like domain-containing protein [Thermocoleostomius sinensis]|uniref:Rhodanese-like domain-containing protein n=1 Tax=Thermocoleostomius sinensis A174 TaxID=2016057 RepID=A0A9E8ZFM8_9CYAN|nr:rhodanese-like domain-containing protein [Thermocoleostomius sinensis]WAL62263.1 rhodanese-like domain-containing protein [Thermocoleostomius sinensis A174]